MNNVLRSVVFALLLTVGTAAVVHPTHAATPSTPPNLIRSATHGTMYYLGVDGMRYVFPNQATYNTWYDATSVGIPALSDTELGLIQIGGNVTYKPGSTLVKIQSDPRIYAIDQGAVLRDLATPEAATALFGDDWQNHITEIEEIYFGNYTIGAPIETVVAAERYATNLARARVATIDVDKALTESFVITVNEKGFDRLTTTIDAGQRVRFVNVGDTAHTVSDSAGSWSTGTLLPGESFTKIFSTLGAIRVFDQYAPHYSAVVTTLTQ